MKLKLSCLGLMLALGMATQSVAAEKMRLGHGLPEDHAVHMAVVKFADLVKKRTNGGIEIEVFANGVLGGEREMLEQVQNGVLEITKASASPLETFSSDYKVFNLPFVFRDRDHFFKVLTSPVGESILASSKKRGFLGLAYYDSGPRSFYGKKPIETPDDLKGMKIRVQQSPTTIRMIQALGATPTPMAWGEVYSALQAGVVDGAENNVTALTNGRHGEVCRFYSETEHQIVPDVLVISSERWDALGKPQQEIIKQAALESYEYQKDLWREFENAEREKAIAMGVKFNMPDKKAFVAKVKLMVDEERKDPTVAKLLDGIAAVK
ncbi:MAG: TRAP transporter substrate-binding protein [Candidatus Accumulibacter sp.]|jgi:tripartite ATP-independent transporter DctP family solute receptor|nr:TRAP transporter substrate-binding protein [Accumulibacter sp.]